MKLHMRVYVASGLGLGLQTAVAHMQDLSQVPHLLRGQEGRGRVDKGIPHNRAVKQKTACRFVYRMRRWRANPV